ncbi:MAG TPA: cytochrome b [Caulobacteraceae bacterium]|jgi:cytochrome b561|nr:cytochrome b [Caulobacteraceae bacterium]
MAIALHWTIAALIVANLLLGWTFRDFIPELRIALIRTHKSIGLTVLALTLARIGWRLAKPPPRLASHLAPVERLLARSTHFAFYVLLLALPLVGWIVASTSVPTHPVLFWGAKLPSLPFLPAPPAPRRALHGAVMVLHGDLALVFAALFALHVAGALKHHFIDGDGQLFRITPVGGPDKQKPA